MAAFGWMCSPILVFTLTVSSYTVWVCVAGGYR